MREDSLEYVAVPITSTPLGTDLSLDTFEMAFATTKDGTAAWHPAIYEDGLVKVLVGPSAIVLAPGAYYVLVRVHDSPETPVLTAPGKFTVTDVV